MAILSFSEVERSDVRSCYRAVVGMSTHALSTDEYRKVHHLLAQVWTTGTTVHDPDEITLVGDICNNALLNLEMHERELSQGWLPYLALENKQIVWLWATGAEALPSLHKYEDQSASGILGYTRF